MADRGRGKQLASHLEQPLRDRLVPRLHPALATMIKQYVTRSCRSHDHVS